MLVTERPGRIRLIENGALVAQPVAEPQVSLRAESGLLGLVADPAFETNRRIYVYLTLQGGNAVERWTVAQDYRSATKDKDLITGIPAAQFHDGGRLRFGPDGMLYIGTGDARSPERSQDWDDPAGKILRVNTEGVAPQDNPRPGKPAFIAGIRNTQGFDWLSPTELVVTDHGPSGEIAGRSGHDEVNVAKAGDNLGWPTIWGCEKREGMVTPRLTWKNAAPPGGAAVYTGSAISEWKGSLLMGVLGSEHLQRVVLSADRARVEKHEVYFDGTFGRLREVVMGPDGHLYVTTSNCDGRGTCGADRDQILRIVPGP